MIYEEDGPGPDELIEDDDGSDDTIRGIVGQFGGKDVAVKVYRMGPHGKSYCYTDGPDITEESIRQNPFGGSGRFTLQVMIGGELRRSFEINIEPPQTAPGVAAVNPDMQRLLDKITALEQRLSVPQQSEPMSAVLNAAVGLINSQAIKPVETPMEQVMKMAEFIVSMRGGGEKASEGFDWGGIASGIAKEALPMLLRGGVGAPAPPPGHVPASRTIQATVTNTAPVAPGTEEEALLVEANELTRQLVEGISYLKKKCLQGADPALYLDFILYDAEKEPFAKLIHLATTQEFEVFARVDPEISKPPYLDFFKFLYDGLRSAFASADTMANDTSGATGDKANPGGNGAASSRKSK